MQIRCLSNRDHSRRRDEGCPRQARIVENRLRDTLFANGQDLLSARDLGKGFTLVELLVVIGIISLLLALLLPTLAGAKAKAQALHCISNLRQWGMEWRLYADDHSGFFCTVGQNEFRMPRGKWVLAVDGSPKQPNSILLCPSASTPAEDGKYGATYRAHAFRTEDIFGDPLPIASRTLLSSYGLNVWIYDVRETIQSREPAGHWKRIDWVRHPTQVPLMLDAKWRGGGPGYEPDHLKPEKALRPPAWPDDPKVARQVYEIAHFVMKRHGQGVNATFIDGSVRRVSAPELWELRWSRHYNPAEGVSFLRAHPDGAWLY